MKFVQTKPTVVFYEKPGCAGNQKQKKLLQKEGIEFTTKSILDTPWKKEELESFFMGLEKNDMINQFAPKIKNNQLDIDTLSKDKLIELMIEEPILIKRPLLSIGEVKLCGFDIEKINSIMSSNIATTNDVSTCQSEDPCKSV